MDSKLLYLEGFLGFIVLILSGYILYHHGFWFLIIYWAGLAITLQIFINKGKHPNNKLPLQKFVPIVALYTLLALPIGPYIQNIYNAIYPTPTPIKEASHKNYNNNHGYVTGSYIGCYSQRAFEQLMSALASNDSRLYNSLMITECTPVNGLEYSILDKGFLKSKARFYKGVDYQDLWVPSEAVQ